MNYNRLRGQLRIEMDTAQESDVGETDEQRVTHIYLNEYSYKSQIIFYKIRSTNEQV